MRRRLTDQQVTIVGERLLQERNGGGDGSTHEAELIVMSPAALAQLTPVSNSQATARLEAEAAPVESLTPRERDVLGLVADGLGNRDVAQALGISEHTVKFHLASIFGKLGASSRTEAVQRGLRLGLIEI